ncbi:MAG: RagB/SusD family nutrient uptake outer membrane protein [Gemmatimonadaceae bacterium]|nr:RagB/SusD family nutrient uptake outer membrane protein [Gemmatimonadaceae bacterium]
MTRIHRLARATACAAGAALAVGCADLELTNPNQQTTDTFWRSESDARQGMTAVYNGLLANGTYGRWLAFAHDIRSDIGFSPSPWADLSNFNKFTLVDFDFEVNREIWQHHYAAIFRANQVVADVPRIEMDTTLRARLVGEARFVRALLYFNLLNLYGGNIPMPLQPPAIADRPASAGDTTVWRQIEADLRAAAPVLPAAYTGADIGRATSGAAEALLGKVLLQQRKWAGADSVLSLVVASGRYALVPNYQDNFTALAENNRESVFEVQFGDRTQLANGVRGLNIAKMVGPCGPSFCDGRPTPWYFNQFLAESTSTGGVDPRLDVTIFYNKPGGMDVYGRSFQARYGAASTDLFFRKYGEFYIPGEQDWDAAINFRVIRYADVLLMLAEARNELGRTAEALPLLNLVRARVTMPAVPAGLSVAAMRTRLLRERLLEFGLEQQRLLDLKRQNLLTAALVSNDAEFSFFVPNKSELLPIPVTETNLNPNVQQNPGWR